MNHAAVLYCVTPSTPDPAIKRSAEDAKAKALHLVVLLYCEFPTLPIGVYGALPYGGVATPEVWSETVSSGQTLVTDRINEIEDLIVEVGASARVVPLFVPEPDIRPGIETVARTCDLAIFASDLRQQQTAYKEMLHAVLFASPIPAIINGALEHAHDTVLLAWNDSLTGARATHLALPYLKAASRTHVVMFDAPTTVYGRSVEPGRDVVDWLTHHGCHVSLSHLSSAGREIGSCILDHAQTVGADLVVSGAYGHSRLRQAVFGGTSRTLIEQETVPVLMAH